jgi:hypothetical protein
MLRSSPVSYIATEAIPAGARVKFTSGSTTHIELADEADVELGTALLHSGKSSYAAGSAVGVQLIADGSKTRHCIALSAITAGATVKRAVDGKVNDTGSGDNFGVALESATADGDIIEVAQVPGLFVTPADASVTPAKLADTVADQVFFTTVAIANTGTPDGVAHITGQVKDAQGNALTGRFAVCVFLAATAYGAPSAQSGTSAALANSRILVADTANCLLQVLTHSDGSWGVEFTSAAGNETVHAHAAVSGVFATANVAVTGN